MTGNHADRKILLAVRDDCLEPRVLASARSLCERMDAELDILARASSGNLPAALQDFITGLREGGVAYSLTVRPALRRRDIVDYANAHECIASVVIDSLEGWETVAHDRGSNPWLRLSCPLVTAAPLRKPAPVR